MTDLRTRIMTAVSDAAYAARFLSSEEQPGRFADIANDCEVDVRDILKREPAQAVAWALVRDGRVVDTDHRNDGSGLRYIACEGDSVRPLVFGDTPQPSPGAVTEAMVAAACEAYVSAVTLMYDAGGKVDTTNRPQAMRAAITAAMQRREVPSEHGHPSAGGAER